MFLARKETFVYLNLPGTLMSNIGLNRLTVMPNKSVEVDKAKKKTYIHNTNFALNFDFYESVQHLSSKYNYDECILRKALILCRNVSIICGKWEFVFA